MSKGNAGYEVGDRIIVEGVSSMANGTYRVVNKRANYVGLTREQEISHPLSCVKQFAMERNMTANDLFDLINAGIDEMYRQGRCLPGRDDNIGGLI